MSSYTNKKRIVIVGSGPTGLAAAYRLNELGYDNFAVYERNDYLGGLCASFQDPKGFVWDLGGHVIFSHYDYFNHLLQDSLGSDFFEHKRQAWIRTMNRWVPYPFQNNLRNLPKDVIVECLQGLKLAHRKKNKPRNFQQWIINTMGKGIAKYFMFPYNFKVWAYPLNLLSQDWVAERVSVVTLKEVTSHLISDLDKMDWGPNANFKFPFYGGTGSIFRKLGKRLEAHINLKAELVGVDPKRRKAYFSNGKEESYDILINTSPLDKLLKLVKGCNKRLLKASLDLKHNGVLIVGLGIKKPCPGDKCWVYFPDNDSPFFRVTYFSNYSGFNVPDSKQYYSLICESAYSGYKKESKGEIIEKSLKGLVNSGLIKNSDRKFVVSKFLFDIDYAYPIPTLKRDLALKVIQPELVKLGIYSRGRFGSWKYEIGNTDHSVMQGKEVVDKILKEGKEDVWNN